MPNWLKFVPILAVLHFLAAPLSVGGSGPLPPQTAAGKKIESIEFIGLVRTREVAARWLLLLGAGDTFDPALWQESLANLYNTECLYDIETEYLPGEADPKGGVRLRVHVKDKWTLYPYFSFQTGGSVLNYSVGLMDYNLLGNFTNSWAQASVTDGRVSYEINFFQPWLGHSDWMAGVGLSDSNIAANSIGGTQEGFVWRRALQQIVIGRRLGTRARILTQLDLIRDGMVSQTLAAPTRIYDGQQYRIRPTLILGKVNRTNFLEEGSEISVSAGFSNFLESSKAATSFSTSWKRVLVVRGEDNLALFARVSGVTNVPLPYQLHLGGFSSIRGFSAYREIGLLSGSTNLEYRPRLLSARTSLLYIDQFVLQGCLFGDLGGIVGKSDPDGAGAYDRSRLLASVGAGFRVFFVRYAGALFRLDVAMTLAPSEGWGLSLGVGQFF